MSKFYNNCLTFIQVAPEKDWNDKYNASGGIGLFSKTEIARCGQHVLKVYCYYGTIFSVDFININ